MLICFKENECSFADLRESEYLIAEEINKRLFGRKVIRSHNQRFSSFFNIKHSNL